MGKLTPMMEQYFEIKDQYKDCLLFFRLGDFYEMFFEDAITASRELEITLTGRDCGQEERAPMCGVPFHSAENYIVRLVEKGYKVAICEQVEDAKQAKGIVKRDVIRVVTPGTVLNGAVLDETKNNYLMSLYSHPNGFGIAAVDITTGEFQTTEITGNVSSGKLLDEIARFHPAEIICNDLLLTDTETCEGIQKRFQSFINGYPDWAFEADYAYKKLCQHFSVLSLDGLGLREFPLGISASGALLQYLQETQKVSL